MGPDGRARRDHLRRRLTVATLVVPLLGYVAVVTFRLSPTTPGPANFLVNTVLGNAVLILPAAVCVICGLSSASSRGRGMIWLGLGEAMFAAGNMVYTGYVQYQDPLPYPSLADIGYLGTYPFLLATIFTLIRRDLRDFPLSLMLEALLSALACALLGAELTVRPILSHLPDDLLARAVGAAYPVADLIVVALIVGVMTLYGRRPGAFWVWLTAGMALFAVADTVYLIRLADGTYVVGTFLDGLWAIGLNVMAFAALQRKSLTLPRVAPSTPHVLWLPNAFTVFAVSVLVYGSFRRTVLPFYVVAVALAILAVALKRVSIGFTSLRILTQALQQAHTDELTQLPNRRRYEQEALRLLGGRAPDQRLAVLMIDLDGFKPVNDTLGHQAGDELLKQIGPRIRSHLRPVDLVARVGGDEFAVLLRDADAAAAVDVAERIARTLRQPYILAELPQSVSGSIGISLCPDHATDLKSLMQNADAAMLDAKRGADRVVVYNSVRHRHLKDPLDIRAGLERGEFHLVYQPQVDVHGRVVGVEALVRWQHPTRGLLTPHVFLPLVERTGLMGDLTAFVLERAVANLRSWTGEGVDVRLSVNISPTVLIEADFAGMVMRVLEQYNVPATWLTLEITEHAAVVETGRAIGTLTTLRAKGVNVSLDDFGTGYSSMTLLQEFPLTEVKIDQSFVADLQPGSTALSIVRATIFLARELGLAVVAEGVETTEASELLWALGCDLQQGWLLSMPLPAAEIAAAYHRAGPGVERSARRAAGS